MADVKNILALGVLAVIAILGVTLSWKDRPAASANACGCASPAQASVKRYAVFWKDNDGYKASPTLFLTLEAASAAIPRGAEEVRIVPVRID
jgi:hypothetical protein